MAQFRYAKADGSLGTVEAATPEQAMSMAPGIAPHSGVQLVGGTPAQTPSAAPTAPSTGSGLLTFADRLNQAVQLAREARNKSSLGMMEPFRGTLAASDFNSILGNLNQASNSQATDLTKQALDSMQPTAATEPKILGSASSGYYKYDPATGETTPIDVPGGGSSGGGGGGGTSSPTMNTKQVTALKNALNASKFQGAEADGKYADPNLYLQNYQSWIAAGGSADQFFRIFPPSTYINPANTWLPDEIMKFVKKPANNDLNAAIDELFSPKP
jgi:hypothetical protein